jgi:hypothetical protein
MASKRIVHRPFRAAGIAYQPGDSYIIAGVPSTDDRWLEATRSITLSNGALDATHFKCFVADWEGRQMLHNQYCIDQDSWWEELS